MYRYFRGMDCTDHLTSILFSYVPETEQQGRLVGLSSSCTFDQSSRDCPRIAYTPLYLCVWHWHWSEQQRS